MPALTVVPPVYVSVAVRYRMPPPSLVEPSAPADGVAYGLDPREVVHKGPVVRDAAGAGDRTVLAAGPRAQLQRAAADRRDTDVSVAAL